MKVPHLFLFRWTRKCSTFPRFGISLTQQQQNNWGKNKWIFCSFLTHCYNRKGKLQSYERNCTIWALFRTQEINGFWQIVRVTWENAGTKKKFTIFREETTSALAGFLMRFLSTGWIEILSCWFFPRARKTTRELEEKPLEQVKNQQQTQPTFGTGWNQTQAPLMGSECSHLCAISAPQIKASQA